MEGISLFTSRWDASRRARWRGGVTIEHWEVVASGPDESEIQDQWNLWDGGLGE